MWQLGPAGSPDTLHRCLCRQPSPSSQAADSLHSPQLGVLGGHHQPRPGPRHQVQHAVLGRARLLVAALVHGEGLGHHERAVHAGVQRAQLLQLLDAAGGGEEPHLAQVSAELHVTPLFTLRLANPAWLVAGGGCEVETRTGSRTCGSQAPAVLPHHTWSALTLSILLSLHPPQFELEYGLYF